MLKIILKVLVSLLVLISLTIICLGFWFGAPAYKGGEKSEHFDGSSFYNTPAVKHSSLDALKWMFTRNTKYWPEWIDVQTHHIQKYQGDQARVTFVNHSTVLIDTNKLSILVDPIWSDVPSPISFFGPKRIHKPGLDIDTLPHVDVILITHNHYDHLDIPTLQKLRKYYNPEIITGLGNKATLEKCGFNRVTELDWGQSKIIRGQKITFVRAQHYSRRGLFDMNHTLWGGFVIGVPSGNIYVSGDTAWGNHFEKIGEQFQPILLAILPIGAYEPRWFMQSSHINPEEAVQAHIALNAKTSLGVHWGTFQLSDEMRFQPVWDLRRAMENEDIPESSFIVLNPGESMIVPYTPPAPQKTTTKNVTAQKAPTSDAVSE